MPFVDCIIPARMMSPSPRRAWIEISAGATACRRPYGRPPHGGRGLKYKLVDDENGQSLSPSPRRAWIEIVRKAKNDVIDGVALPTEGVD